MVKKRIIVLTEEELKELTIFDIFHEVFGTTKPEVEEEKDEIAIKDESVTAAV
jgi:hypothetical protein